jgi:hypothetical protein
MKEIENTNRYQSSIEFFTEIEKNNSFIWKKKIPISIGNFENSGSLHDLKLYCKAVVIRIGSY